MPYSVDFTGWARVRGVRFNRVQKHAMHSHLHFRLHISINVIELLSSLVLSHSK